MDNADRAITVLVADDQELFRRGMQTVLATETGFDVVGEACDGAEAVARVGELAPDVDAALERALGDRDWQVRQAAEDLLAEGGGRQ